jgi:hypothetical protein
MKSYEGWFFPFAVGLAEIATTAITKDTVGMFASKGVVGLQQIQLTEVVDLLWDGVEGHCH